MVFEQKTAFDRLETIILKDIIYKKHNCCEICGTMKDLTIHHKESVSKHPEKMFDEDNLQVLCRKCHDEIHRVDYKKWKKKHDRNI